MEKSEVIQVCTDGSPLSDKAALEAIALAKATQLPLVVMTSVTGSVEERDRVRACLTKIAKEAKKESVEVEMIAEVAQSPYEGILKVAKRKNARFIVMASRGLGTVGSFFLGSETQKVLASADRPVLVIR